MLPGDHALTRIAEAIADGTEPDWTAAEPGSLDETSRTMLSGLRAIADVARVHATLSTGPPADSFNPAERLEPPAVWGSLRLVERIGQGRFGDVYRAWDPSLDREVAVKLLRRPSALATGELSGIVHEGRLMARVRHPNVVTVFGAKTIDGRTGVWMEFVRGRTLEAELQERGPLPPDELARVGVELCRALAAVHAAGLVHRDVKPTNVMRDETGRIVLGDFGTGRELEESEDDRRGLAGTPAYLAPEIFARRPATHASDLYSLGALLFHLGTGALPIEGRSIAEIGRAHERGRRSFAADRPEFPARLAAIIDRALDPDPTRRFASAHELARALEAVPRRRRRWLAAAGVIAGAAALAGVAWSISVRQARTAERPEPASVRIDAALQRAANLRAPSLDGRLATCTPWGLGAVAVCDLETGAITVIRRPSNTSERSPYAVLSADNHEVAYVWSVTQSGASLSSLRIVALDGGRDREVYRAPPGAGLAVLKWMTDGRGLVLHEEAGSDARDLTVDAGTGAAREVWRRHTGESQTDVSPDGRWIALARATTAAPANRDLFVVDLATGRERPIAANPADDAMPIWAPAGDGLAFVSDRAGGRSLFYVPIRNGAAAGEPVAVHEFGRQSPFLLGVTTAGRILVRVVPEWSNVFVAPLDLARGVLGPPERVDPRSLEEAVSADWSPDGSRIAYLAGRMVGEAVTGSRIVIRTADGRAEERLSFDGTITRGSRIRWSRDSGRLALLHGFGSGVALDVIDLRTHASRRLAAGDALWEPRWGAGGESLYYGDGEAVWRLDLRSGKKRVVYRPSAQLSLLPAYDISPIDDRLAAAVMKGGRCTIEVALPGARPVDLASINQRGDCVSVAWTRDATRLLVGFVAATGGASILSISTASGVATRLATGLEPVTTLSVRPDEGALVFSAGNGHPVAWSIPLR